MRKYLTKVFGAPDASTPITVKTKEHQVRNEAGGYVYSPDAMTLLHRFLILGSEGGSYYAGELQLTRENAANVEALIKADGLAVVNAIVEVSEGGRAPKNDPALFALAMCASFGDAQTRSAALAALPRVARIGTHLFTFAQLMDGMRGWGRGLRSAVAKWYTEKPAGDVAFQVAKYGQRNGWSHRDLLRLSHPKVAQGSAHNAIFHYAVNGWESVGETPHPDTDLVILWALERLKLPITEAEVLRLIDTYRLPMELIPSEKQTAAVYERMLETAGLTWLIRNLGNLTKHGVLKEGQHTNLNKIVSRIVNADAIRKARIHPLAILVAAKTYARGSGVRGGGTWPVLPRIVTALDDAFELAFRNVTPSGKRFVLGLDISGSMSYPDIAGMPGISPMIGTAAMALITARTERQVTSMAFETQFVPFPIGHRDTLSTVVENMAKASNRMGGTDCALPMTWALKNKVEADAFVIYTDSQSWAGTHPDKALEQYRQKMGIDARLIVCAMVANRFTIGDPNDKGTLSVAGFDTATPDLISQFAAGSL
jgi:60 kDa SS-A/Ro ribonucleoprotein